VDGRGRGGWYVNVRNGWRVGEGVEVSGRGYFDDVFMINSNTGLCISEKVSIICSLCLLRLYMSKHCSVFNKWPFLSMCSISIVLFIVRYVCPVSSICWAYFNSVRWFLYLGCVFYIVF
jgi:hypothetical protein